MACGFSEKSVILSGSRSNTPYTIKAARLHQSPEKVRAIVDVLAPANVSQLCSFLGMINYYRLFIPNLSSIMTPLNGLLCKGKPWSWTTACESPFQEATLLLVSTKVLTHYDPKQAIRLACDASPYAVGAVISHVLPSGEKKPIAFASRTLSKAEQN